MNVILLEIGQYNMAFDLKINLGHSDLYFMVQWFFFFYFFCSEKHFSVNGKAQFRRATLSCDSSYWILILHGKGDNPKIFNFGFWQICWLYSTVWPPGKLFLQFGVGFMSFK